MKTHGITLPKTITFMPCYPPPHNIKTYHHNMGQVINHCKLRLFQCFRRTYYQHLQNNNWYSWHTVFQHITSLSIWTNSGILKLEGGCSSKMSKQKKHITWYKHPKYDLNLNNCHENPKTYHNHFTLTSEDVHSSKRPAMYRSCGPLHPPS